MAAWSCRSMPEAGEDPEGTSSPEQQFLRVASSRAFKDAAVTVERLLACNSYRRQLGVFRGLRREPQLAPRGDYALQHLWSFGAAREAAVTALCWNPADADVLAVGYGRFAFGGVVGGAVRCWNVKNPVHAERCFDFRQPVTALDFSKARPNLAVVGLHDGSVLLLDVSSEKKNVVARSSRDTSPSREPVWQASWFAPDPLRPTDEQVLTCNQDGRVCRYWRMSGLVCAPVMRLTRVKGSVHGLKQARPCAPLHIPVCRHPAALVLTRHPEQQQTYYVGTEEGLVHKCSLAQKHRPLDSFLAHLGPVYGIHFSAFHTGLLLSCGADCKLRVWAEGVWEPLVTLACGPHPVQGAAWNPANSTVLAAVAGADVLVWDLRRRATSPVRRYSPLHQEQGTRGSGRCTAPPLFTADGRNLVAADERGQVHVLALDGTPPAPLLPREALSRVLRSALHADPDKLARVHHLL